MAGALTRNNAALVGSSIGRQPTEGELYIAHFLGADGAGKLINAATTQPQANAAAMFPQAAAANHSIFYDASGRARSVGEVYSKLTQLFDVARAVAFAQGGVAATGSLAAPATTAPPSPAPVTAATARVTAVPHERLVRVASRDATRRQSDAAGTIPAPDTAGVTQAFASASEQLPPPPAARPSFQSMFYRSGQPAPGADREQSLGASPHRSADTSSSVRPSICSPTRGPTSASCSAAKPDLAAWRDSHA